MTALIEIKEQELSEIDLESQHEMDPCLKNGVFRRYHVTNNPVNYIDPSGLESIIGPFFPPGGPEQGCGPWGIHIPDVYGFKDCCIDHDRGYKNCDGKGKTDCRFCKCLMNTCEEQPFYMRPSCFQQALFYCGAVSSPLGYLAYPPSCY
jgi:hypothetical protein